MVIVLLVKIKSGMGGHCRARSVLLGHSCAWKSHFRVDSQVVAIEMLKMRLKVAMKFPIIFRIEPKSSLMFDQFWA